MGVDALRMEAEVSVTNERVQNDRRLRMVLSCSSSLLLLFVRALSLVDLVVLVDTPLATKDDEGDGWNAAADNSRERKTSDVGFMFIVYPFIDKLWNIMRWLVAALSSGVLKCLCCC